MSYLKSTKATQGQQIAILLLVLSILKPVILYGAEVIPEIEKNPLLKHQNGRALMDFDAPPTPRNRLTDTLYYGVKLDAKFEHQDNYNLNDSEPNDLGVAEGRVQMSLLYTPVDWFYAFANIALFYGDPLVDEAGDEEKTTELNVRQANISFPRIFGDSSGLLRIGRQRIKDKREWYFDENLDGFRLLYGDGQYYIRASITRLRFIDEDLLSDQGNPETNNFFLRMGYSPDDKLRLEGFALYMDDPTDEEGQPVFLGARAMGKAFKNLKYWVDIAYVFGKGDEVKKRVNGEKIKTNDSLSGFGFDIGASYMFNIPLKPYITLGYAFATGDDNPDDSVDHTFRQTGLQDNTARFHGKENLKYYGEVFDPELSNMSIFTAGLGIRPTRRSSVDLIYHYYRQDEAVDEIRDTDIDANPDGIHKNLGQEVDLVIGSRDTKNLHVEFNFGYFWPGNAFAESRDNAFLTNIKATYRF